MLQKVQELLEIQKLMNIYTKTISWHNLVEGKKMKESIVYCDLL